jgi:hypothetical protein
VFVDAMRLRDRFSLVGSSLTALAPELERLVAAESARGHPVFLYAWSMRDAREVQAVKRLARRVPGVGMIGVCVDPETDAARQFAVREKLPGGQYLDARGNVSPPALRLHLDRSPQVYLADRSGTIRDVNGLVNTAAKLAEMGFQP